MAWDRTRAADVESRQLTRLHFGRVGVCVTRTVSRLRLMYAILSAFASKQSTFLLAHLFSSKNGPVKCWMLYNNSPHTPPPPPSTPLRGKCTEVSLILPLEGRMVLNEVTLLCSATWLKCRIICLRFSLCYSACFAMPRACICCLLFIRRSTLKVALRPIPIARRKGYAVRHTIVLFFYTEIQIGPSRVFKKLI
jgi:hypothetical protein